MQPINSKYLLAIIIRIIVLVFMLLITSQLSANTDMSPITCENNTLICSADELEVKDIEHLLFQECGIRITGLKAQEGQYITYHAKGPMLETMKRLLRYLNAESYVFEFNGDQLTHVLIYSRGKTRFARQRSMPHSSQFNNTGKKVNAVKVLDIVPGSQAEIHGFQKNDIIIEYDTVPITSASQLVSVVKKKKKEKQRVELVLVRDGSRQSFILDSGLIGVRIQTIRVSPDDIN